jgi:membrane protein implicated in regulation of membrane protease activity
MLPIEPYLVWLIAGFVLVLLEMLTGTFYLLVLGIAAFAGAGVALSGGEFWVQTAVSAAVAMAGMFWIYKRQLSLNTVAMKPIDSGQPVTFESWLNRTAGHARVRYRDASWEAFVEGQGGNVGDAATGDMLYVIAIEGNTLRISRTRPV